MLRTLRVTGGHVVALRIFGVASSVVFAVVFASVSVRGGQQIAQRDVQQLKQNILLQFEVRGRLATNCKLQPDWSE